MSGPTTIAGHLKGEAARRFPQFCYRKVIPPPPIRSIFDLDPDRVYPDRPYPRWTSSPGTAVIQCIELVDFEIRVGQGRTPDRIAVSLHMLPHRPHTSAQEETRVLAMEVDAQVSMDILQDEVLSRAIR